MYEFFVGLSLKVSKSLKFLIFVSLCMNKTRSKTLLNKNINHGTKKIC